MASLSTKRAHDQSSDEGQQTTAVKKQRLETTADYISHFRDVLLPLYNPKNQNHVARMIDLMSGDMRHYGNIVFDKLRLVVEPIKNPSATSTKTNFTKIVHDISNDSSMSIMAALGVILWPSCGLTGNYKDGSKFPGKSLDASKYKFSMSATAWTSQDRDANGQSRDALEFFEFCTKFCGWLNDQIYQNPLLALNTKAKAREAAEKALEDKNKTREECGLPPIELTEQMVREKWFALYAKNPIKLVKDKTTKKVLPHTEHIDFSRGVVRGLTKAQKEAKDPNYQGLTPDLTAAYHNDNKILNPIVFKTYDGEIIPLEKYLTRPLQTGDVCMVHFQPLPFDDSAKDTNGSTFTPAEVIMYQFAKPNGAPTSNVKLEGGQQFPGAALPTPPPPTTTSSSSTNGNPPPLQHPETPRSVGGPSDEELAAYYENGPDE
jgi:hypothetical protein